MKAAPADIRQPTGIESTPIVDDGQDQGLSDVSKANNDLPGASVANDVDRRLVGDVQDVAQRFGREGRFNGGVDFDTRP
jgi:hypothetical protein